MNDVSTQIDDGREVEFPEGAVNIAQAKEATNLLLDEGIPVFWEGPPGVGKSDGVRQIAQERGWSMIDFRALLRNTVDLLGVPFPNPETRLTEWFPPSELPQEKRDGKEGILFLDELNAAHPQVQAACFGLVLDRKLGDYKLPDGWRIIAAGNRRADRSAAQPMPRALANRFAHFDIWVDHKQWLDDFALDNCHPWVCAFIRWKPGLLHKMNGGDERRFPTPRAWERISRVCDKSERLRFINVRALVGVGVATEFEGFVRVASSLPDLDDILRDPKRVDIPREPSACFLLAGALARAATRQNFDRVMTYAQRMTPDFEVIIGLDASKHDVMVTKTKAYIEFQQRHKHLFVGKI